MVDAEEDIAMLEGQIATAKIRLDIRERERKYAAAQAALIRERRKKANGG